MSAFVRNNTIWFGIHSEDTHREQYMRQVEEPVGKGGRAVALLLWC